MRVWVQVSPIPKQLGKKRKIRGTIWSLASLIIQYDRVDVFADFTNSTSISIGNSNILERIVSNGNSWKILVSVLPKIIEVALEDEYLTLTLFAEASKSPDVAHVILLNRVFRTYPLLRRRLDNPKENLMGLILKLGTLESLIYYCTEYPRTQDIG